MHRVLVKLKSIGYNAVFIIIILMQNLYYKAINVYMISSITIIQKLTSNT